MTSRLVMRLADSTDVWTTNVLYKKQRARPLWAAVGPIHRQVIPYLLRRATSDPGPVRKTEH
jgi:hypothetical protein